MVAARMAVPFLQEVELGKRPKLPKSIKRQSLNEMAAFVAGEAGQSEPQNVESRVWRPSLARHSSGGRCLDHRYRWNDYYGDHGFRTLTPLILVRIQVPQPVISMSWPKDCRVIAHPVFRTAGSNWGFKTPRMACRGPMAHRRAVSMTDRMSAYCLAPHWERKPLVIFR